ncbi:MAG: 2-C-methyl-D-erythritol 2,4-cyclodiphosphate synthase [Sphaerochaetaceae bacterium]
MRVGTGWDIHRLVEGRPLRIGGVTIESDKGALGHSDGDVLLHALIDALLGACALGDIGKHFPPDDENLKGIDSTILLNRVLPLLEGYEIVNIDCTVILERIRLAPYIDRIRESIASLLSLDISSVSVKAKSAEMMMMEVGTGDALIAQAAVLIEEKDSKEDLYWV